MTQALPEPAFKFSGLDPLFCSPVLSFQLPDAEQLNPLLLREIAVIRAAEPGIARSNRDGWHSRDDLFQRTEPGLSRLAALILGTVGEATLRIAPETDLTPLGLQFHGWINVNPTGAFNAPHDHPGWFWSGSYYVTTPEPAAGSTGIDETAGCIEFLDSRTNLAAPSPIVARCMASKIRFRPTAGMLLMFPSHLRHWVYPNAAPAERVSIAFNVRFIGGEADETGHG